MTKSTEIAQSKFYTEAPGKTSDSELLINVLAEGLLEKKPGTLNFWM
jgi:hypothetical protein